MAVVAERLDGADTATPRTAPVELQAEPRWSSLDQLIGLSRASLDPPKLYSLVASAARRALSCERVSLLMLDGPGGQARLAAVAESDAHPGLPTHDERPRDEQVRRVTESRQPLRTRGEVLIPIEHGAEIVGVLVAQPSGGVEPGEGGEALLQLVAVAAGTALERAWLHAAHERQQKELLVMERAREAAERLTEATLAGSGVEGLTRVTADVLGSSVVLADGLGNLRAAVTLPADADVTPLWLGCLDDAAFADRLRQLRLSPPTDPRPTRLANGCLVPIVAAGELLAVLGVFPAQPIAVPEDPVLRQVASTLAGELLRERELAAAERRLELDLLDTLFGGGGRAAPDRAALLGHDLGAAHCVVALGTCGEDALDRPVAVSAAGRVSAGLGLRSLVGEIERRLVVVLTSGDRELSRARVDDWAKGLRERLASLGFHGDLHFGISPVAADGHDLRSALEAAGQALAVGELARSDSETHFDDVELLATLVSAGDAAALRRFVRRSIGQLEDHDSERGSSLVETLETYLDHSGVARHAAQALFLHPHSLRYRLRRIDQIQGVDLNDPISRLMLHLALKLRSLV